MPRSAHPAGPVDLVAPLGHHHLRRAGAGCRGRRARATVMHDGSHPVEQLLLVDLPDDEAVVLVVHRSQARPAATDEHAAVLRTDRLDDRPRAVLVDGSHAAEPRVHRPFAGVQERQQLGREWAFVGQDPCTGLHDIEALRPTPRAQGRVGSQQRPGGEHELADVANRRQTDRGPVGVDRLTEQLVEALAVQAVQHVRAEEHVPVRDAQLLGHRRPDELRHGGRHDHVASCGRLGHRVVLRGDEVGHALLALLGRRRPLP